MDGPTDLNLRLAVPVVGESSPQELGRREGVIEAELSRKYVFEEVASLTVGGGRSSLARWRWVQDRKAREDVCAP